LAAVAAAAILYAAVTPAMLGVLNLMRPEGTVLAGDFLGGDDNWAYSMVEIGRTGRSRLPWLDPAPGGGEKPFAPWPVTWPYLAVGRAAALAGVSDLVAYNAAAAIAFLLYVLAAYYLLRCLLGRAAPWAFLLFLFAAGFGGLVYLGACLLSPEWRFLVDMGKPFRGGKSVITFELFEGTGYIPFTIASRLYYPLSLAPALGAVGLAWRWARGRQGAWRPVGVAGLVFASTLANLRFGFFAGALVVLAVLVAGAGLRRSVAMAAAVSAVALGALGAYALTNRWPANAEAYTAYKVINAGLGSADPRAVLLGGGALWIPATAAGIWICRSAGSWGRAARFLRAAALYAACVVLLYGLATLAYYVSKLLALDALRRRIDGRDAPGVNTAWLLLSLFVAAAALAVPASRWLARRRLEPGDGRSEPARAGAFLVLWYLGACLAAMDPLHVLGLANVGPIRLVFLLWLPLAGLAALGLERMSRRSARPRLVAVGGTAALVALGLPSLVLYHAFQVALPLRAAEGAVDLEDSPFLASLDVEALETLGREAEGRMLSSRPVGTFAPLMTGCAVVWSGAARDLVDAGERRRDVGQFYHARTADERRLEILRRYGVRYVFWGAAERRLAEEPADFTTERPAYLEPMGPSGRVFRVADEVEGGPFER
jgi:hypothetical protein